MSIGNDLAGEIRVFARANSVLPSVVFLSAFKLVLHRYTSVDDVIVGMPVMTTETGSDIE